MNDSQEFGGLRICLIMSSLQEGRKYTRARKRPTMNVDLNSLPPCESRDQDAIPNHTRSQDRQGAEGNDIQPPPIDVEALDDDVIISSPTAFAEAKNNSRRNGRRPIIVDVDSDERASHNKRSRVPANRTISNCDLYISLDDSHPMRKSGQSATVPPAPPAPIKEATFSCPICMGPFVEEMTTKCGHIFCKGCIQAAIAAQAKCPTCRKRTTKKDIIRVYLPAARSA